MISNIVCHARHVILSIAFFICVNGHAQVLPADSMALVEFYWCSNGPSWTNDSNWLTTPIVTKVNGVLMEKWHGVGFSESAGETPPYRVLGLTLDNNNLNGILCQLICNLSELRGLDLHNNNLSGTLPSDLGLLKLQHLNISNNHFTNPLPLSLGNDTYLGIQHLFMANNDFYGQFPDTIMELKYLHGLRIQNNKFTNIGTFHILVSVTSDFSYNKFTFKDLVPLKQQQLQCPGCYDLSLGPQDSLFESIDTTILVGSNLTLDSWVDTCSGNRYTWYKNGNWLNWQSTNSSWTLNNAQVSHSGNYTCMISNPSDCAGVYLWRKSIHVNVTNSIGILDGSQAPKDCNISYNLTDQLLNISLNLTKEEQISSNLYDEAGRKVLRLFEGTTRQQDFHHYLGWMKKGVYIVKVRVGERFYTGKTVVY